MKKTIAIFLTAALSLGCLLCGCGAEQTPVGTEAPMTQPTLENQTDAAGTAHSGETTEAEAATVEIQLSRQGEPVQTEYYTITLPSIWANQYVTESYFHEEDTGYSMTVCHKDSKDADAGGDLFSIDLYPDGTDYSFLPAYELLGKLTTPTGVFSVVARYPTDVRFTEQTADSYRALEKDIPSVLDTLTPAEGCTFEAEAG